MCEKHSPNLFFCRLQISSPNSAAGELSHEAALSRHHHYRHHHQSLFIHEIIPVLHGFARNRVEKLNIIVVIIIISGALGH